MVIVVTAAGIELKLDSAQCIHIPNSQGFPHTPLQIHASSKLEKKYSGTVKPVTEPHHRYNCHGLVFGARRTVISEPETVKRIIAEDGYKEVPELQTLPGDVILYVAENGDPEHSGIVVQEPRPASFNIPLIVSKWGAWREYVHPAATCPYEGRRHYYRIAL